MTQRATDPTICSDSESWTWDKPTVLERSIVWLDVLLLEHSAPPEHCWSLYYWGSSGRSDLAMDPKQNSSSLWGLQSYIPWKPKHGHYSNSLGLGNENKNQRIKEGTTNKQSNDLQNVFKMEECLSKSHPWETFGLFKSLDQNHQALTLGNSSTFCQMRGN